DEEVGESFSPDGRVVSFVRGNNLYVLDLPTGHERALTNDGNAKVLNGRLDWIYQEEVYGRGNFEAYWWSPDSTRIAFLRLDETPVPTFAVVDHIPPNQGLEVTPYPKAGDPNPLVRLGIVDARDKHARGWTRASISQTICSLCASLGRLMVSRSLIKRRTASRRSSI